MTPVYVPRFETQTDQGAPLPWTNCTFAAVAMLVDWWTWGARRTSDVALRAASGVPVDRGANFATVRRGALAAVGLDLRFSEPDGSGNANLTWAQLREHLASGGAAAVAGDYAALGRHRTMAGLPTDRWQPGGRFGHAALALDYRPDGDGSVLFMDPLGRGGYAGDRIPLVALWEFLYTTSKRDEQVRVAAATGFAGTRPPRPSTVADLAGTVSAFGTRYPSYVHDAADALAWVNRNIRRYIESGALRL